MLSLNFKVTIDPKTPTIRIEPCESDWKDKSPEQVGTFKRENPPRKATVTPRIRAHHVSNHSRGQSQQGSITAGVSSRGAAGVSAAGVRTKYLQTSDALQLFRRDPYFLLLI